MQDLLAEAVFAGNSLISYNGATPYNARFGRQPRMLPDMLALPDDVGGVGRNGHRLRELALQKIVEAKGGVVPDFTVQHAGCSKRKRTVTAPSGLYMPSPQVATVMSNRTKALRELAKSMVS